MTTRSWIAACGAVLATITLLALVLFHTAPSPWHALGTLGLFAVFGALVVAVVAEGVGAWMDWREMGRDTDREAA